MKQTIGPARDVLNAFIELLELPRTSYAGIAVEILRQDRRDALKTHLAELKRDITQVRAKEFRMKVSVENALGLTIRTAFTTSYGQQQHYNLQRVSSAASEVRRA